MVRGSEAEGDLYGDQASAHWGESAAVFGISPVRDMLPCSHIRNFGVRDAGCGKVGGLMATRFFLWGLHTGEVEKPDSLMEWLH